MTLKQLRRLFSPVVSVGTGVVYISYYVFLSFLFGLFLCLVLFLFRGRYFFRRVKVSPFECGFDPKDSARLPFSVRFFLLAVLFLVFDIEIALVFPLVFGVLLSFYVNFVISGMGFLFILLVGLLHEWREGSLRWVL